MTLKYLVHGVTENERGQCHFRRFLSGPLWEEMTEECIKGWEALFTEAYGMDCFVLSYHPLEEIKDPEPPPPLVKTPEEKLTEIVNNIRQFFENLGKRRRDRPVDPDEIRREIAQALKEEGLDPQAITFTVQRNIMELQRIITISCPSLREEPWVVTINDF